MAGKLGHVMSTNMAATTTNGACSAGQSFFDVAGITRDEAIFLLENRRLPSRFTCDYN